MPVPAPLTLTNKHVMWNSDEWRTFAFALTRVAPFDNYLHNLTLEGLTLAKLNEAMQSMPPERTRRLYSTTAVHDKLLEVYAKARQAKDPLFFHGITSSIPSSAPKAPVAAPASAEVAPPRPAPILQPTAPVATAAPTEAFSASQVASSVKPSIRQPHVRWDDEEWCLVAAEIQRKNPHKNFMLPDTLLSLRINDVKEAQHVLPTVRQRRGLDGLTLIRLHPSLQRAFNQLQSKALLRADTSTATNIQAEEEPSVTYVFPTAAPIPAPAAIVAPSPTVAPAPAVPAAEPTVAPVAAAQPEAAPAAVIPPAAVNAWEAAFKPILSPFVSLLASEVMRDVEQRMLSGALRQVFMPMLTEAVQQLIPALQASLQPVAPAAPTAAPAAAPAPAAKTSYLAPAPLVMASAEQVTKLCGEAPTVEPARLPQPKTAPTTRRFKIGIFGNRNTYNDELVREFKHFDIVCVDNKHQVDRLRGCDRVYAFCKFNEHAGQERLKSVMGSVGFTRVNGSLSTLKRLLRGLAYELGLPV